MKYLALLLALAATSAGANTIDDLAARFAPDKMVGQSRQDGALYLAFGGHGKGCAAHGAEWSDGVIMGHFMPMQACWRMNDKDKNYEFCSNVHDQFDAKRCFTVLDLFEPTEAQMRGVYR